MKIDVLKTTKPEIEKLEAELLADLRQGLCHTPSASDYCADMRAASKAVESFAHAFARDLNESRVVDLLRLSMKLERLAKTEPVNFHPPRTISHRLMPTGTAHC